MALILKKEFFEQIICRCRKEYPDEACGILAGKDGVVKKVYQMTNIDKSPSTYFMDAQEQLKTMKEMRNLDLEMLGIYHSHPDTSAYPSARDIEMAFYPDSLYLIVSLEDRDHPQMRAFNIVEGRIKEEQVQIIS